MIGLYEIVYLQKQSLEPALADLIREEVKPWRIIMITTEDNDVEEGPVVPAGTREEIERRCEAGEGSRIGDEKVIVKDGHFFGILLTHGVEKQCLPIQEIDKPVMISIDCSVHGYDHAYTSTTEQWLCRRK